MTQRSGKFTRGPCSASLEDTGDILLEGGDDVPICGMHVPERTAKENIANVRLMAAAFNAAAAAEDMGYDGQAAVEALPELLEVLREVVSIRHYTTPAGTTNCRFCDNCMDHLGTFEDMHDKNCVISKVRAALAKAKESGS